MAIELPTTQGVARPVTVLDSDAHRAVRTLLRFIGQDPEREGIEKTPQRVAKALREMTEGYRQDPAAILSARFEADYDEMVVLRGIPRDRVVGLSKLARLTQCFAKRLQLQERMTREIATALDTHLAPVGVGVIVKAQHQCMACRGVKQSGAVMLTSSLLGAMREPEVRAEFLRLSDGR